MALASETTLNLDPQTAERVQRLAAAKHRTVDSLLREAVEDYISRAEAQEEFLAAGIAAAAHYDATGLHVTQEEMEEWIDRLVAGEDAPPPQCHT
jgi:predicted transcriptional regulator